MTIKRPWRTTESILPSKASQIHSSEPALISRSLSYLDTQFVRGCLRLLGGYDTQRRRSFRCTSDGKFKWKMSIIVILICHFFISQRFPILVIRDFTRNFVFFPIIRKEEQYILLAINMETSIFPFDVYSSQIKFSYIFSNNRVTKFHYSGVSSATMNF